MPHYDYVCEACGHEFEIFQSMSESTKKKCPECGKLKLYRKIGAGAGVLFKGSGFYETDYRSDSYKKGESSAKKESTPPKSEPKKAKPKESKKDSKKKPG
jgi:putative FmdB family regulatory protein